MVSNRLEQTFRRLRAQGETGLIPFLTVGFPDLDTTLELVPALAEAGAHIIELGVPFSDPLADGATIQKASFHALRQGITLRRCLEVCATLRERGVEVPLVLMGYYNPVLTMGLEAFAQQARESGLDGIIVVDLPPDESGPLREACQPRGIDTICLLAPTSTDERIAKACAVASGFVYCITLTGVTGARDRVSPAVTQLVQRVRVHTDLPVAVGFGISRREHIEAVGRYADAAVVGSALVDVIEAAPRGETVAKAAEFIADLTGNTRSVARGVV